jgi:hypothetical protein
MMTVKVVYVYKKTQSFVFTLNVSRFIISWCKTRLKKVLLSWYCNTKNMVANILTKAFFVDKHEYF